MRRDEIIGAVIGVAGVLAFFYFSRDKKQKYERELEGEVKRLEKKGKILPFIVGEA